MAFRKYLFATAILMYSPHIYSQCCGGGSGSPIAGGASQGVLQEKQVEANVNYQNINTSKALNGDTAVPNFIDYYYSQYIYSRMAYGVTKNAIYEFRKLGTANSEGPLVGNAVNFCAKLLQDISINIHDLVVPKLNGEI